jgi:hypothetical protein
MGRSRVNDMQTRATPSGCCDADHAVCMVIGKQWVGLLEVICLGLYLQIIAYKVNFSVTTI